MTIETKVSKGLQTSIPSIIREKNNIEPEDIIEWNENENGEVILSFRKKITEKDICGIIKDDYNYDAVKSKKQEAKGIR